MATIQNFEDLDIWIKARQITRLVYLDFKNNKDFGFKDQIQRASVSIMNNIAEGFCRDSDAEFKQFLKISKGSAGEIKNMYYVAEDLRFLNPEICQERRIAIQGLSNGISAFMKYLKDAQKLTIK
jgi:four helix bundle protein